MLKNKKIWNLKLALKKSVHLSLSVGFVRSHWVQLNQGIIWSKHFKATKHHLHEAYFSQNNLLRSPRYFFIFLTLEECKHMIHHIILTYDLVRWLGVAQIWRPHDSDGSALFGKVWKEVEYVVLWLYPLRIAPRCCWPDCHRSMGERNGFLVAN